MKDMTMKSLHYQVKLMTLMIVYIKICARRNSPIYCKATSIDIENLAVAGVIVVHAVIVIRKMKMKLMLLNYIYNLKSSELAN